MNTNAISHGVRTRSGDAVDSTFLVGIQRKKLLMLLQRGAVVTGITVHVRNSEDSDTRGTVDPWGRVEWTGIHGGEEVTSEN